MLPHLTKIAIERGLVLQNQQGVHVIEVATGTGVYWARCWLENGKECIVADQNGEMIETCKSGIMIDIGAHVGRYTIPMALKADHVYAFEPEPKNFDELLENTKRLNNVTCIKAALTERIGKYAMSLHPRRLEHKLIHDPDPAVVDYVAVDTLTLDYVCFERSIDNITGIKIDVEGAEEKVLRGAEKTLRKESPMIALETHLGADCGAIYTLLESFDYTVFAPNGVEVTEMYPDVQYICRKKE